MFDLWLKKTLARCRYAVMETAELSKAASLQRHYCVLKT